jgi:hypothetical protein
MFERMFELDWCRRIPRGRAVRLTEGPRGRAVRLTEAGRAGPEKTFGVELDRALISA